MIDDTIVTRTRGTNSLQEPLLYDPKNAVQHMYERESRAAYPLHGSRAKAIMNETNSTVLHPLQERS